MTLPLEQFGSMNSEGELDLGSMNSEAVATQVRFLFNKSNFLIPV